MKKRFLSAKSLIVFVALLVFCAGFFLSAEAAPNLPPEIQADQYLLKAKSHLDKEEYGEAQKCFEQILALKVPVPDEFYYQYGRCLAKGGKASAAEEQLTIYLQKTGRNGRFYKETLMLLNDLPALQEKALSTAKKAYETEVKNVYKRTSARLSSLGTVVGRDNKFKQRYRTEVKLDVDSGSLFLTNRETSIEGGDYVEWRMSFLLIESKFSIRKDKPRLLDFGAATFKAELIEFDGKRISLRESRQYMNAIDTGDAAGTEELYKILNGAIEELKALKGKYGIK